MDKQSYTIKFVLQKKDLEVLKKALLNYQHNKFITQDLLGIINRQEENQK